MPDLHDTTSPAAGRSPAAAIPLDARYGSISPAGSDTATPLNLAKRLRLIERYAVVRGRRVLDCGCGAGDYVRAFLHLGADAWGIEFSQQKLLSTSRAGLAWRLSAGDLHDLAFADATMDVALMNEVLEHVPDERRALREVHRVLRPGGSLLIFSPNRRYPFETHGASFRRSGRRIPHYAPFIPYIPLALARTAIDFWARNYWPRDLRRLVAESGFTISHTDYVWQTFEGISGHQPAWMTRIRRLLQAIAGTLEQVPLVRTLGVSQVIVARKGGTA
jgi:ubiquinone/menaquinone biosynthesis C-methylase UbiE